MIEAERQLIGAWLNGKYHEHIQEFDTFEYFDEVLQAIKKVSHIDYVSVAKKSGISIGTLTEITEEYSPTLYDGYYRHLKEEQIKTLLSNAYEDFDSRGKWIDQILLEQGRIENINPVKPVDMVKAFEEEYQRRLSEEVMPYGIADLDFYMGGLRRKELTVIASRPSMGKTALSLQIAYNLGVHKNKKVLFFSLEMAGSQVMERFICKEAKVEHAELKTPKRMTEYSKAEMGNYMKKFPKFENLIVFDNVNVLSQIQRLIEQYKPDIVFIDQLSQLRENRKFNSFREQFTYMTNTLKAFTMMYDIAIVLMAQINRDAQNTEPTLANLKESGSIEEDADNVIMIHQKEEIDRSTQKDIPVILMIRKQRNGMKDIALNTTYKSDRFTFTSDWYERVEAMAWEI